MPNMDPSGQCTRIACLCIREEEESSRKDPGEILVGAVRLGVTVRELPEAVAGVMAGQCEGDGGDPNGTRKARPGK